MPIKKPQGAEMKTSARLRLESYEKTTHMPRVKKSGKRATIGDQRADKAPKGLLILAFWLEEEVFGNFRNKMEQVI